MREIKFRAIIPNKEMAKEPGHPVKPFITIYFGCLTVFADCNYTRNLLGEWLYLRNVVDQYTGLKDKNGEEIYEGDIVRYKYTPPFWRPLENPGPEKIGYFFLDKDFLCFGVKSGRESHYMIPQERLEELKVIGNIHENRELLVANEGT